MAKKFTYYGSKKSILTPAEIFGANYYDDWDYGDAATVSLTGALIDGVTSKGLNGAVFSSTGVNRPSLVSADINGYDVASFNGSSNYAQVAASTGMYNFLHNTNGGVVISIFKCENTAARLIGNRGGTAAPDTEPGVAVAITSASLPVSLVTNASPTGRVSVNVHTTAVNVSKYHLFVNALDNNNATAAQRNDIIFDNNSEKNNVENAAPSANNAGYNMTLGRRVRLNDQYLQGSVARVIIIDTIPTPTQLTQLNTYLTATYGTFPV